METTQGGHTGPSTGGDADLPASRGIVDKATGFAEATAARETMTTLVMTFLPKRFDFDVPRMTMLSLLTRAQGFHDGAVAALAADNPFATFTLLRSYAENAAMLCWLVDKPADIERIYPEAPPERTIRIGQLTNYAENRLGGFRGVYAQLSKFAHPGAGTALSGWHAGDENQVHWASAAAFKNDDDYKIACFWVVELAEANGHLWAECWEAYFGEQPTFVPPEWPGVAQDEADVSEHP